MQDLLLSTNPMLLGLIGINTIALVSLLGSVVSQRDALNRLEQALGNSQPALPEEKLAGLLTPVIEEEEPLDSAEVEMPEVIQEDLAKQQPEVVVFTWDEIKRFTFFDRCNHGRASVKKFLESSLMS